MVTRNCIPAYCAYSEFYGYITERLGGSSCSSYRRLYTCKHPDTEVFEMVHTGSRPICKLAIPPLDCCAGKFLLKSCNKATKQKFVVPCMKKGSWHTRFMTQSKTFDKQSEVYSVGIFNTAQEAYVRAGAFINRYSSTDLFKNGLPEHLVMELIKGCGEYPKNVKEQFVLPYLAKKEIPYMDTHSIMLPQRVLERQDVLESLIDIKISGNQLSWRLKNRREK